jgi:hypothetical protein
MYYAQKSEFKDIIKVYPQNSSLGFFQKINIVFNILKNKIHSSRIGLGLGSHEP